MKIARARLAAAATGGLLAGSLLGLVETVSLIILSGGSAILLILLWAVAAYGFLGLIGGVCLGLLASLLFGRWLPNHVNWWGLMSGALVFTVPGLVVIRFRLLRDLFVERVSLLSATGLILHIVLLAVFGTILVAAWWIGRRWAKPVAAAEAGVSLSPTDARATAVQPISRRTFLKASLATGVLALPAAAAASQLVTQSKQSFVSVTPRNNVRLLDKPNIILIVADTLRADHLGVYGYAEAVTPYLDDLAAQSIRFTNAFSQAAWTKPSMTTLLTSLYPSSHNTRYKSSALPDKVVTLPEILAAAGYVTGGFANNVNIAPFFNFQKGFIDYEFLAPDYLLGASEASSQLTVYQTARMVNERFLKSVKSAHNFYQPAEVVNEWAIDWLTVRQDDRFFLFLHYMDPHDPYFEHPFNGHGIARVSTPNPSPDMASEMVQLYDREITYMDRQIGELFDWLKKQGLYDDTMIVFTADHGEEFYEHGGWWHGLTLYDEQIHVPLLIKMPGLSTGAVDPDLARSLDIAPTIVRVAGLDVPETMQGVNLIGDESTLRAKFVYAEEDHQGNILRAGRSNTWKLMEANAGNPRGLPSQSLFHVTEDPGETHNLSEVEPARMAMGLERLDDMSTWARAQAVTASHVELDQARKDAIERSGYGN